MSKPCKQMSKIVKNVKSVKMSRLLLFQYIICFHFLVVFFFFSLTTFFLFIKSKLHARGSLENYNEYKKKINILEHFIDY